MQVCECRCRNFHLRSYCVILGWMAQFYLDILWFYQLEVSMKAHCFDWYLCCCWNWMKLVSFSWLALIGVWSRHIAHFSMIVVDIGSFRQTCLNMFERLPHDWLHFQGERLELSRTWRECIRHGRELLARPVAVSFETRSNSSCTNWHHCSSCIPAHAQYPSPFIQFMKD